MIISWRNVIVQLNILKFREVLPKKKVSKLKKMHLTGSSSLKPNFPLIV